MAEIVQSNSGVTLVGGGKVSAALLERAVSLAPLLVAADSGCDRALALGHTPQAVFGDLDSLGPQARARLPEGRLHHIAEQESTDFDKALRSIGAAFVLAVGFAGGRLDHALAAFNTLARHANRRCLLLGTQDVCFLSPRALELKLPVGTRLSLFPMGPVRGQSSGLRWPIDGIDFAPGANIGTSNEAREDIVRLQFDAQAMLVILPGSCLEAALDALVPVAGA